MIDNESNMGDTPPSPNRLKRKAEQLRADNPQLSQRNALDEVARQYGASNYNAYFRAWSRDRRSGHVAQPRARPHRVTLIARWEEHKAPWSGTETVQVATSQPWWEFLTLEQRRSTMALASFRIDQADRSRLVSRKPFAGVVNAHFNAHKAARVLSFVDETRVLPAHFGKACKALGITETDWRFPAMDHEREWFDPLTGCYFLTNEPYYSRLDSEFEKQEVWARNAGYKVLTLPDIALHNPQGTVLQFVVKSDDAHALDSLKKRCRNLPVVLATMQ